MNYRKNYRVLYPEKKRKGCSFSFREKPQGRKLRGTATVEAAIVLPLVILAFTSIISIIRIAGTYERIQHALNQVASELSQYSYLYAVSGLKEQHDTLYDNITEAKEKIMEQQNTVSAFYESLHTLTNDIPSYGKSDKNIRSLYDTIQNIRNTDSSLEVLSQEAEKVLKDPMGEIRLISLALSDTLFGKTKTALMEIITKSMLEARLSKELSVSVKDLDNRLRIQDGIEGLDLSSSTFFNDMETIDLIVEYTVKPMPDFILLPEIRLRNRACMLAWTWGSDKSSGQTGKDNAGGESIWNIDGSKNATGQHLGRGKTIDKRYAEELACLLGDYAEVTPYNFKTVDVIEYAHDSKSGTLYTIFSLNPFLPTYHKKSAVIGAMKQNINKLNEFVSYQVKDYIIDMSLLSGEYKRVVYAVIPENRELPEVYHEAFEESRAHASKFGIELIQVQRYGEYENETESGE